MTGASPSSSRRRWTVDPGGSWLADTPGQPTQPTTKEPIVSVQHEQRIVPDFPIDQLHDHPDNPRLHDEAWLDESVDGTGFSGTVVAQESTKRILDGHGRVHTLRRKGETTVPVCFIDVDDEMALKILLSRNPPKGSTVGYDDEALAKVLSDLAETGALYGTGYTADALDDLMASIPSMTDLPPQEFTGGYVESPEELAERAKRVAVTQASQGLREMVFVWAQDDYDDVQRALGVIGAFHASSNKSGSCLAAIVNYSRLIEDDMIVTVQAEMESVESRGLEVEA